MKKSKIKKPAKKLEPKSGSKKGSNGSSKSSVSPSSFFTLQTDFIQEYVDAKILAGLLQSDNNGKLSLSKVIQTTFDSAAYFKKRMKEAEDKLVESNTLLLSTTNELNTMRTNLKDPKAFATFGAEQQLPVLGAAAPGKTPAAAAATASDNSDLLPLDDDEL
jgi:hypothetical protein